MTNRLRANLSWMVVICAMGAFADNIPANSDLADMHDYFYYASDEHKSEGRANHTITTGGEYTLSADKVWSQLSVTKNLSTPILLNLGGHTLTGTGCDVTDRPLICNANSIVIISNGTFKTVFDTVAYPWTYSNPQYYTGRQGVRVGTADLTNAKLIIANGGTVDVNNGASNTVSFVGYGNRVIVEDGGTLNSLLGVGYRDNWYVFKKGATFSKIRKYRDSGKVFPVNLYYEPGTVSNVIEICDSKILTDADVTTLRPAAYAKKNTFHCGLSVCGPDFNWRGNVLVGQVDYDNSPVLFEMKGGAKITAPGELSVGQNYKGSRSLMTMDGVGTEFVGNITNAGRIGANNNSTNSVLRLSNWAFFSASNSTFHVGYFTNSSYNAMEAYSGGRIVVRELSVGRSLSRGNRVLVSGEGSTMTNTSLHVGNQTGYGGGENTVIADNYGSIYVGNHAYVGYGSSGNSLVAKNYGKIKVQNSLSLAKPESQAEGINKVACSSNRLEACDGGEIYVGTYIFGFANNSTIIANDGAISAKQIFFAKNDQTVGTNNLIEVSGRYGFIESREWTTCLKNGGKIRIVVPEDGFADRKEVARAPIQFAAIAYDDTTSIELDVSAFTSAADSTAKSTPLIYCADVIPDVVWNKMTKSGDGWSLERSSDKKTLTLKRHFPLILEFY